MPLTLVTLPVRDDNYVYLIHDDTSGATALVDCGAVEPILGALKDRDWTLTEIWLTHHHHDHIEGIDEIVAATGARITGAAADAERLPKLDREVAEGRGFDFAGHQVQVFDVPGHTVGHIAYYIPDLKAAFTADSLMALGCGRLFEGTAAQMWDSLTKLAALPDDTTICSGHEYTQANARFALTIDPDNAALQARARAVDEARAKGEPTVPTSLAEEKATNPFLRAADPLIRRRLDLSSASDAEVFAEIRARKDRF
ncbi:hydroxyacylglutathione hydrolase [Frigidibacter sp. ROC022]|uniref:hydroxyacylglutathione hydrolase n=1 Tax=Frigidibacter sp. ROC022 TaxID=2971796 RepID=UPI00215AAEFF|nr:hydroxyacylglutathione hydrolase [Frigidibacter sp. ROC022]MCR8722926.1 hydroxyacylglutathione hydrolase [Frigidibacter sp. ROC022]